MFASADALKDLHDASFDNRCLVRIHALIDLAIADYDIRYLDRAIDELMSLRNLESFSSGSDLYVDPYLQTK